MSAPQNDAARVAIRSLGLEQGAMDALYDWIQSASDAKALAGFARVLSTTAAVTPAAVTGVTVTNNGRLVRSLYSVTINAPTAFTAAAQTQDLLIGIIPNGSVLVAAFCYTSVAYVGLAGTIAIKIGTAAGGNELILSHDVKSGAILAGEVDADLGATLAKATSPTQFGAIAAGDMSLYLRCTSGTGNLGAAGVSNLTVGTTQIAFLVDVVPF